MSNIEPSPYTPRTKITHTVAFQKKNKRDFHFKVIFALFSAIVVASIALWIMGSSLDLKSLVYIGKTGFALGIIVLVVSLGIFPLSKFT